MCYHSSVVQKGETQRKRGQSESALGRGGYHLDFDVITNGSALGFYVLRQRKMGLGKSSISVCLKLLKRTEGGYGGRRSESRLQTQ